MSGKLRDLSRLLRPKSIAVVGGSWSRSVLEQCQRMQFAGDLWPIHPSHDSIFGLPCYRSVDSLPQAPDACFIGVNRNATVSIVEQLARRGSGGAVCFASGFSESSNEDASGIELQQQLLDAAGQMPVVGPNCYGMINYLDGALLWPDQHGGRRVERGVALITQSSNIAINLTMQKRALPIAYVMTAGNQAQTSIADMGMALLDDPRVTALGLHIEGFGDLRGFERLAEKARTAGKGIVAIKVGRSVKAQSAMVSHTNSLNGSDAASDAFLERLGIARVDSISVLLESLNMLHVFGPLPDNTIASMSCSGGEASLMADAVHTRDLHCPDLSAEQQRGLREALGPMVALANPLDYHTYIWNDLRKLTATFTAMLHDAAAVTFLIIDFPRDDRCQYDSWLIAIEALLAARNAAGTRVAVLVTLPENISETLAEELASKGLPVFHGIEDTLDAVLASVAVYRSYAGERASPVLISAPEDQAAVFLAEAASKKILHDAGLTVPQSIEVESIEQALSATHSIGYPVALKVTGVAHKTEVGGVYLNINTDDSASDATRTLLTVSERVLIEEFIENQIAEVLVGVVRDASNMFILTLGAGGMMTELLRDTVTLLLPVSNDQIEQALNRTRIAMLLYGYRGRQGCDINSLVQAIQCLCNWVQSNASRVDELEINPIICQADRAVVADALIRMRQP
ncbi:acyl-CoA synthetase [Chromatiales bacterium (ex Bugula neritina AB1)]|nr:acyl-CoA synthetase [Chromatiales bacterium (ex Bugula neritina AB1)]